MRVAFYTRPSAFQSIVGGETKLLETKKYMEQQGIEVHLFDQWHSKLKDYDILQIFGSQSSHLDLCEAAKIYKTAVAVFPILWLDWRSAISLYTDFRKRIKYLASFSKLVLFSRYASKTRRLFLKADLLFPNSVAEAKQVKNIFRIPEHKIVVVPNGVDKRFAEANPEEFIQKYGLSDFILYVGSFNERKNQLRLIRAMKDTDIPIVFIGEPQGIGGPEYYEKCKREASKNMFFLGYIHHDSSLLMSAYAAADTFVLPSLYETPGRSALEAGLAGAKVVITDGGCTKDYFQEYATYVKPNNLDSIRKGVLSTYYNKNKEPCLKDHILQNYAWEVVVKEIIKSYQTLIES